MKKTIYNVLFVVFLLAVICSCDKADQSAAPVANGMAGSMARFAITGDHLYTVDSRNLKVFDISTASEPVHKQDIEIGFGIETIFPYQQKLFIGSQQGMYIYDIENPLNPVQMSIYSHVTSCDPVVVQGDFAYVTLRSGTDCRFGQNLLDVLNISNPNNPELVSTTGMLNPHGLGIINNTLFVCEGEQGIKVFNVENPENPELIYDLPGFHAYDVIVWPNVLIVTGNDGLYQYDYQDLQNLQLLSVIPVKKN